MKKTYTVLIDTKWRNGWLEQGQTVDLLECEATQLVRMKKIELASVSKQKKDK